jgi:hypothetical protein
VRIYEFARCLDGERTVRSVWELYGVKNRMAIERVGIGINAVAGSGGREGAMD